MIRWVGLVAVVLLVGCQSANTRPTQGFLPTPQAAASPSAQPDNEARNATVQWWFRSEQQDAPDVALANAITEAKTEVDAAIYAFNRSADVSALAAAQQRCNCVRVISDSEQSQGTAQVGALQQLQLVGIPIKVDAHTGIMHMKVLEFDKKTLMEGSFNWTNAASTVNDEVLFRINSAEAATAFASTFDQMWNDTKRFKVWQAPTPTTPTPVPALSTF